MAVILNASFKFLSSVPFPGQMDEEAKTNMLKLFTFAVASTTVSLTETLIRLQLNIVVSL